jgi:uncharacterized metal-binding protein
MCASNVLRQRGINPSYEVVVAKEGVDKLPSLDFADEEVEMIADRVVEGFLKGFLGGHQL